jgi:hypothetical protein
LCLCGGDSDQKSEKGRNGLRWPAFVWILHSVQNDGPRLGWGSGLPPYRKMRDRMGHPFSC